MKALALALLLVGCKQKATPDIETIDMQGTIFKIEWADREQAKEMALTLCKGAPLTLQRMSKHQWLITCKTL